MSKASWVMARVARLPPARATLVAVEHDLEVKTADGIVLLADRWHPVSGDPAPIVLVRSPYGRRQFGFVGRLFAERGLPVRDPELPRARSARAVRSTPSITSAPTAWTRCAGWRTRPGSAGRWAPSARATSDSRNGRWPARPPSTCGPCRSASPRRGSGDAVVFPGDSFSLETGATWVDFMESQELPAWRRLRAMLASRRRVAAAFDTLPLREADLRSRGHRIGFYQDWLVHEQPGDPWWDPLDFSPFAAHMPPASFVGGWYDLFLPALVEDFVRVRRAGGAARLTIGPWSHVSSARRRHCRPRRPRLVRRPPEDAAEMSATAPPCGFTSWGPTDGSIWRTGRRRRTCSAGISSRVTPCRRSIRARRPRTPTGTIRPIRRPESEGASLDVRNTGPRRQDRREQRRDVLSYSSDPMTARPHRCRAAHRRHVAGVEQPVRRPVRPPLRCRSLGAIPEYQRRDPAARPAAREANRLHSAGPGEDVANCSDLPEGTSDPAPGVERRPPAFRSQPGVRGTAGDGRHPGALRHSRLPRRRSPVRHRAAREPDLTAASSHDTTSR